MKQIIATLSLIVAATLLISCGGAMMSSAEAQHEHPQPGREGWMHHLPPFENINTGIAVLHPTAGNEARGTVRFEQDEEGNVSVIARIEGLAPNQQHGFHVHEYGDCSADDATSAGSHYNPGGHPHGLPNGGQRHAGDFGNLESNANGVAEIELTVDNITLAGLHNPVIGRAVIVHADDDDGSQPTGDAGARLGCGVIGVANPQAE